MIGFAMSESQGIAWAEAWSTNVPTLIWRNNEGRFGGKIYASSTAPYLCDINGLFFNDFEDFKLQFHKWEHSRDSFAPREWVLNNMSDEICASKLYSIVQSC